MRRAYAPGVPADANATIDTSGGKQVICFGIPTRYADPTCGLHELPSDAGVLIGFHTSVCTLMYVLVIGSSRVSVGLEHVTGKQTTDFISIPGCSGKYEPN